MLLTINFEDLETLFGEFWTIVQFCVEVCLEFTPVGVVENMMVELAATKMTNYNGVAVDVEEELFKRVLDHDFSIGLIFANEETVLIMFEWHILYLVKTEADGGAESVILLGGE